MALLLTSLLLLCAGSSWSVSSDALVVTQSPDVSVQEGETGNITCCWNGTERVGIKWLKNQTLIENKTVINQTTGSKNEQKSMCSVLIIENMTKGDSGKYICKVSMEMPRLTEVEGNGTTITVTARENITKSKREALDHSKPNYIIFILICLPILLLIAALICVGCLVHKAQKNQPPAAPGNKSTSAQSREEEPGDDGGTEREEEENEETMR